ncbi:hypothetical protein V1517DRAFT_341847 [Lipomyces orientalis]|uniref:Uncharacterized protein n=1 Tax=Lipomyces orientalis TaxID=1233043 RepID=A0ACC3TDW8_9ASCO
MSRSLCSSRIVALFLATVWNLAAIARRPRTQRKSRRREPDIQDSSYARNIADLNSNVQSKLKPFTKRGLSVVEYHLNFQRNMRPMWGLMQTKTGFSSQAQKQQHRTGQRADIRKVMIHVFNTAFSIIFLERIASQ